MSIARKITSGASGGSGDPVDPSDPDFANVSLLLDGDGNNGTGNNTFTDSSSNNSQVYKAGRVIQGSFSPYAALSSPLDITTDGGSGYFQYQSRLYVPSSSSLNIGSKMSAEAWIYVDELPSGNIGTNGQCVIFGRWQSSGSQRSWFVVFGGNGQLGFWFSPDGSNNYSKCQSAAGAIQAGQWHHVAVTWEGKNQRLFVDGKLKQTLSNTVGPKRAVSAPFEVNSYNNGTTATAAKIYMSDVRFFNNANAPWTSNFTPPSRPVSAAGSAVMLNFQDAGIYNLTGKSNVGNLNNTAVSTAQKKYGTGSIRFPGPAGVGTYLTAPENGTDFTFGTGDFTIECWVYIEQNITSFIFDWRKESGYQGSMPALYVEDNKFKFYDGAGSIRSNEITDLLNQWRHVAVVRMSGQVNLYVDGTQEVREINDSDAYISPQDGNVYIGGRPDGLDLVGYMDDIRITKGVAVYTGNFTPPTQALPKY